jgi:hypothetical protein
VMAAPRGFAVRVDRLIIPPGLTWPIQIPLQRSHWQPSLSQALRTAILTVTEKEIALPPRPANSALP